MRPRVAIAVKGDRAVAYVCDGRRLEAWLTGTFTTGQLALRSRTGERLVGRATAKSAVGTFTLRGRTLHFAISAAGPPAGLYRSASNSRTIGWIVLPDGSQVGVDNDGTPAAGAAARSGEPGRERRRRAGDGAVDHR